MQKQLMLAVMLVVMARPCMGEVFVLQDGSQVEGTLTRASQDGRVVIGTKTGVRSYLVSEFTQETRAAHFPDLKVTTRTPPRPVKREGSQAASSAKVLDAPLHKEPPAKAVLGLMIAGALVSVVGALWMMVSAFAESPVWGIAFLLSAGLGELAFIFVHWDRAKPPLLVQAVGLALFIAAMVVAR